VQEMDVLFSANQFEHIFLCPVTRSLMIFLTCRDPSRAVKSPPALPPRTLFNPPTPFQIRPPSFLSSTLSFGLLCKVLLNNCLSLFPSPVFPNRFALLAYIFFPFFPLPFFFCVFLRDPYAISLGRGDDDLPQIVAKAIFSLLWDWIRTPPGGGGSLSYSFRSSCFHVRVVGGWDSSALA